MTAMLLRQLLWPMCALLFASAPLAQEAGPDPEDLARSELAAYIDDGAPDALDAAIARGRQQMAEVARRADEREIVSTTVFRTGIGQRDLATLAADHDLEVVRIELKIPSGGDPHVMTVSIGPDDLLRFEAPLQERLKRAIGRIRLEFLQASEATTGNESEQFRRIAMVSDPRIFRAELIGKAARMGAFARDPAVLVAFPEDSQAAITGYRDLQRRTSAARIGPPIEIRVGTADSASALGCGCTSGLPLDREAVGGEMYGLMVVGAEEAGGVSLRASRDGGLHGEGSERHRA
jgi:hypothetical protein